MVAYSIFLQYYRSSGGMEVICPLANGNGVAYFLAGKFEIRTPMQLKVHASGSCLMVFCKEIMTLHPNYRFENFAIYNELYFSWPSLLHTYLQSSGFVLSSCMLQQKRIRFCWLSCLRFKLGGMKFGTLNSLWMASGKNLLLNWKDGICRML